MTTHNPKNERIKREYLSFLKEGKGNGVAVVDAAASAIHRFEMNSKFRDFHSFHVNQATAFKARLAAQLNAKTRKPLSKATVHAILQALKTFFEWLAGRPGFRRDIFSDAGYFRLSAKDTAIAKTHQKKPAPTLEQVRHVIFSMPHSTDIERRNRALVAFTISTCARDDAIASMCIRDIDLIEGKIRHDARHVRSKFSKTFDTWFFPVGDDIHAIVAEWVQYLKTELLWGLDDPLFGSTRKIPKQVFAPGSAGLHKRAWSTAAPIRKIFKAAFNAAGLPYFNPHSFRDTLTALGEQRCRTAEEFKAWSQNIGHEKVLTTFMSYGQVAPHRQAEVIRTFGRGGDGNDKVTALAARISEIIRKSQD